jgi:alpha-D-xyloside xylohydrolase
LIACNRNTNNVILLKNGKLEIIPYTKHSARILFYPSGEQYPQKINFTIIKKPEKIEIDRKETAKEIVLSWGIIKLKIDKKAGSISYYKSNEPLFKDIDENSFSFEKNMLGKIPLYKVEKRFDIPESQGLYGLGQFQDGKMNFKNHQTLISQANQIAVNPLLVSTSGYGILWDNYSKTWYKNNRGITSFTSEYAAVISYFLIVGENMDEVIKGYRELTGDAPLFGKWAYGYWQSKERYKSFEELKDVVREYRARKLPLDNIVQDWKYWGENPMWSALKFDSLTYPNPEKNIEDLHNLHAHLMVSVWPSMGKKTDVFKEMDRNGFLYGHFWSDYGAKLYDAYTTKARDIYWKYIKTNLIEKGVDALWMDGTEPELTSTDTQEITEKEIIGCTSPTVGPLARYLNPYSLLTTKGVYEGQRAMNINKRVFILTRSAFTGQQRNAAVTWSGDITAKWDVLKEQIAGGINFSMSGIPYWTHDIGAFFVGRGSGEYPDGCKDLCYRELYTRWFQFGAFSPIFRSHGTGTPREIWRFGDEGGIFYEALKKASVLRYRLMPYIYSTAWRITSEGYSIMRAIPMDFPNDTSTYNINDQYLFGESFLVKPVTKEMYYYHNSRKESKELYSEKSIDVYLPGGIKWYDFWTGNVYEGGQTIKTSATIDKIPLYVKTGAIVPLGPSIQYADEKLPEIINLLIFCGKDGSFTLYEDDGNTYNYEKGLYATIKFDWNDRNKTLIINKRIGQYPEMLTKRRFVITLVHQNLGELMNINEGKIVEYIGEKISVEM